MNVFERCQFNFTSRSNSRLICSVLKFRHFLISTFHHKSLQRLSSDRLTVHINRGLPNGSAESEEGSR
jgi:hypothetical protein